MLDPELIGGVEATIRGIAAAGRAMRLYPPTSPMLRQAVEAAAAPVLAFLDSQPSLVLNVARDGFTCRGTEISRTLAGSADLADILSSHGIAELVFTPGCTADDMSGFLNIVMRAPESVRANGGIAAALAAGSVSGIRVITVSLTVAGQAEEPAEGADVDEFFRELGGDPDKLSTWLAAAASGDPATLAEGLGELADAAGPVGLERFLGTFADAFARQENDGKDVVLGIAMEPGRAREIVEGMMGHLPSDEISGSLSTGLYGKNMLSLSTALTHLPLGARLDEVIAEVRASLPDLGHNKHETDFLDHMLRVRSNPEPEQPLLIADDGFHAVAEAANVDEDTLAATRADVAESVAHTAARSVPAMLALLDQQRDFNLYVKSLDALAGLVPRLIEEGDTRLAVKVLDEIAERENRATQPWPELTKRLRDAKARATGRATMRTLLDAALTDAEGVQAAHSVLRHADEGGKVAFVEEALTRHDDRALDVTESLLGRRMVDMLAAAAPRVGTAQLGPLVRRLAAAGDASAMLAVEAVLRRPEELARVEAAEALAGSTNPAVVRLLAGTLRDPSPKVAATGARALARTRLPGAADALAERLEQLDVDGKDFALGREFIAALAQMPDLSAAQALRRLAERKALIKRGRFVEVQQLAREALTVQAQRGAR